MSKIVVAFPTEAEGMYFHSDTCEKIICGAGMAECASATADICTRLKPDMIILAGVAGTYSCRYPVLSTVVVGSETIADLGRFAEDGFTQLFEKQYLADVIELPFPVVSSNTVNCASAHYLRHTADVENMEGASFFAVARRLNVNFIEIRNISNEVGEKFDSKRLDECAKRLASDLTRIISMIQKH